jgi:hypothetical protein
MAVIEPTAARPAPNFPLPNCSEIDKHAAYGGAGGRPVHYLVVVPIGRPRRQDRDPWRWCFALSLLCGAGIGRDGLRAPFQVGAISGRTTILLAAQKELILVFVG